MAAAAGAHPNSSSIYLFIRLFYLIFIIVVVFKSIVNI